MTFYVCFWPINQPGTLFSSGKSSSYASFFPNLNPAHSPSQARVFVVSNVHTHSISTPSSSLSRSGPDPTPALQGLFCPQRSGLLFVGNLQHKPNQAAILYMIKDVLPALLKTLPPDLNGIQLHIVGSNQLPWGLQTVVDGCRSVKFHGWMADDALELLYGQVWMSAHLCCSSSGGVGNVNNYALFSQ